MIDTPMTRRELAARLPEYLTQLTHIDRLEVVPVQVLQAEQLGRRELLFRVQLQNMPVVGDVGWRHQRRHAVAAGVERHADDRCVLLQLLLPGMVQRGREAECHVRVVGVRWVRFKRG